MTLTILHTADWHLGRTLHGRAREAEFEAFLDWLLGVVEAEAIDVLLLAGDVFDTTTPGHRAQALYYGFLHRLAASRCRHAVIIGGNHDSPSFLDAPRELLNTMDVHVVGAARERPEDEVVLLADADGAPQLLVCAVPYLRDRDLRVAEPGEQPEDKARKLLAGMQAHYAAVAEAALRRRDALGVDVPIVGMGHLFTAGGQTVDGDGVRDLYVGSLAHVPAAGFPACFDYLALGHLHVPQRVGGADRVRYSGSPLPMGFGEAGQRKQVCIVTVQPGGGPDGRAAVAVREVSVPVFQRLARLRGDWDALCAQLEALTAEDASVWLEVTYEGDEVVGELQQRLQERVAGTQLDILRVRNPRVLARVLAQGEAAQADLDDLTVDEVFERCLEAHEVPGAQRDGLRAAYREAVLALAAADPQAAS